mgnify:CR=1 FL=1
MSITKLLDSLISGQFEIINESSESDLIFVRKSIMNFSKMVNRHDVIVVTINYRLGAFGWFTHPAIQNNHEGIDKTSNFGTLDIIEALKWVNKNIKLFGGDPNNITIFGESAGGHNVLSLLIAPQAKGLFHKAISQSGYTTSVSKENAFIKKKSNYSFYISIHNSFFDMGTFFS